QLEHLRRQSETLLDAQHMAEITPQRAGLQASTAAATSEPVRSHRRGLLKKLLGLLDQVQATAKEFVALREAFSVAGYDADALDDGLDPAIVMRDLVGYDGKIDRYPEACQHQGVVT